MSTTDREALVELRRDLHRRPEPAWREFYTTCRIVDELERLGFDAAAPRTADDERYELHIGPAVLADEYRKVVPDDAELDRWFEQARDAGARSDVLERLAGGYTGALAVFERGSGPTVALRVDIDGLEREESDDEDHAPAAEGFRSVHEGMMHACGHDAHATFGVGTLEAIIDSEFEGTLKVFFQPGEELGAGGEPMAESGHLDDVDYLLAVHVGLDRPTGTVVPGISTFLAVSDFRAEFRGAAAHAGGKPNAGRNAVQAMATAARNLHAIPRHEDGATRVNVAPVGGGTATNIVPEFAFLDGEVRGETTELCQYMKSEVRRIVPAAAELHDCEFDLEFGTELPTAPSDDALVDIVADVAAGTDGVDDVDDYDEPGGSEDATFLMREVQENSGLAAYVGVGTDHPGGHHTATFDVDEASIPIAIDVLTESIRRIAANRP